MTARATRIARIHPTSLGEPYASQAVLDGRWAAYFNASGKAILHSTSGEMVEIHSSASCVAVIAKGSTVAFLGEHTVSIARRSRDSWEASSLELGESLTGIDITSDETRFLVADAAGNSLHLGCAVTGRLERSVKTPSSLEGALTVTFVASERALVTCAAQQDGQEVFPLAASQDGLIFETPPLEGEIVLDQVDSTLVAFYSVDHDEFVLRDSASLGRRLAISPYLADGENLAQVAPVSAGAALVWPTEEGHLAQIDARTGAFESYLAPANSEHALVSGKQWHGARSGILACVRQEALEFWRPKMP